ncbi:MAG TPA: glycosyltransferase [Micromonosporaceae bacterium]
MRNRYPETGPARTPVRDRTRVALLHGLLDPARDGVADYVTHLVPALRADGVEVVALPVPSRPAGDRTHAGDLRRLADLRRRIAATRPDLVHVQFAPSAFRSQTPPGLLPLAVAGTPLVATLHEYGGASGARWLPEAAWRVAERHGWWDRDTWRLVPASDAVVVTNPGHAALLRDRTGREPVLIPLAPNVQPVPPGDRQRARRRRRLDPNAPVLVFFGFVHPVKGVRYLIEAVARLRREHPDLRLVVVGGFTSLALPGDEAEAVRRDLQSHAARHGVADAVTFTGHLPEQEVSELLSAADVAVLPFTAGVTAKSGALLSVLAHGLPTVVTRADRPDPELVDGVSVVEVADRRDPTALAAGISRLLRDPTLRARVAEGGAAVAGRRTWPALAAAHHDLYRRLLAGERA